MCRGNAWEADLGLGRGDLRALGRVRIVGSFEELMATRFEGAVNALCWPRTLVGDFGEVVDRLGARAGMTAIEDEDLLGLVLSPAGALARDVLLADQALLRGAGLDPMLEYNTGYPRDEAAGPIPTDVYSFHVDRATGPADTFLCTYLGKPSEGLANEAAVRRVDVAATRAQLLEAYCGLADVGPAARMSGSRLGASPEGAPLGRDDRGGRADDAGFAAYLAEHSYDLHYAPQPGALPFSFGIGCLWRIAIAYPGCPVLPCIHRAPLTLPGDEARLLLIS